jgi:hypothetical protein
LRVDRAFRMHADDAARIRPGHGSFGLRMKRRYHTVDRLIGGFRGQRRYSCELQERSSLHGVVVYNSIGEPSIGPQNKRSIYE